MKFKTVNEFDHFIFDEIHVTDVQITNGFFHIILDDVIILPENSCNRDIRKMRCNGLVFKVTEGHVVALIEDGYKLYDADGNFMRQVEDKPVPVEQYDEICRNFADVSCYSIVREEKDGEIYYTFTIDDEEGVTYSLVVAGTGDTEEWDRFLNLESSL